MMLNSPCRRPVPSANDELGLETFVGELARGLELPFERSHLFAIESILDGSDSIDGFDLNLVGAYAAVPELTHVRERAGHPAQLLKLRGLVGIRGLAQPIDGKRDALDLGALVSAPLATSCETGQQHGPVAVTRKVLQSKVLGGGPSWIRSPR